MTRSVRSAGFVQLLLVAQLWGGGKSLVVETVNPAAFERKSETVSISLADVAKHLGNVEPRRLAVLDESARQSILSQVVDDSLIFQSNFRGRQTKRFVIQVVDGETATPGSQVDGRFVLPREDYAWENDRIAFRMYGPKLAAEVNNGIDVWVKRVRYPIVAKWYAESAAAGKDTYHQDRGEGADFFSVGKSLGAGGSGIWFDGRLHQPGVFNSCRTIANGPVRIVFELTYDRWEVGGKRFSEVKRISLDAGQQLNRIDITLKGLQATDTLTVAIGLAKRNNTRLSKDDENCWMSLWGPTNDDPVNGELGIGAVAFPGTCVGFSEDAQQYMMLTPMVATSRLTYYAGAGWTRSATFPSEREWIEYLRTAALRWKLPIGVRLIPTNE